MMNAECGMMNMKAGLPVLIHHSAFRIHHFLSCPSCPSLLIFILLGVAVLDDTTTRKNLLHREPRGGAYGGRVRRVCGRPCVGDAERAGAHRGGVDYGDRRARAPRRGHGPADAGDGPGPLPPAASPLPPSP